MTIKCYFTIRLFFHSTFKTARTTRQINETSKLFWSNGYSQKRKFCPAAVASLGATRKLLSKCVCLSRDFSERERERYENLPRLNPLRPKVRLTWAIIISRMRRFVKKVWIPQEPSGGRIGKWELNWQSIHHCEHYTSSYPSIERERERETFSFIFNKHMDIYLTLFSVASGFDKIFQYYKEMFWFEKSLIHTFPFCVILDLHYLSENATLRHGTSTKPTSIPFQWLVSYYNFLLFLCCTSILHNSHRFLVSTFAYIPTCVFCRRYTYLITWAFITLETVLYIWNYASPYVVLNVIRSLGWKKKIIASLIVSTTNLNRFISHLY